jgi:ElaB/YqjD/DUF883 family membrane-anchored ribosome-binding protein
MTEPNAQSAAQPQAGKPQVDPLAELQERFGPQLEEMQERLLDANEKVKTFIKKHPGATLLGAAAVGFLIGKWASRR